jgi:hypothetical protein
VLAERLNKIEASQMRRSKKLDFSLRHALVEGKRFDEEQTNAIIEVSHDALVSMFDMFYRWHMSSITCVKLLSYR